MEVFDLAGKSIFENSPKRKKKYILFLFHPSENSDDQIKSIEKSIQKSLKNFILVRISDPDEGLKALIVKNVEVIVIDHSLFNDDAISIDYAVECKKRKKCPILFLTRNPDKLVYDYREKLYSYEEADSYFNAPVDIIDFSKKLVHLEKIKGRVAKRFSLNIPLKMFRLNNNQTYSVYLSDISLVGFGIEQKIEEIFLPNEQVQIKIPLTKFKLFHPQYGEFLPISGKLQRVSINGERLGFRIEFATALQMESLCEVLSVINYKSKFLKFSDKKEFEEPNPRKGAASKAAS